MSVQEQQRLWIATICTGIAFYPLPPLRSGAAELLLGFLTLAVRVQTSYLLIVIGLVALVSLLPVGIFLLWSRPRFDRPRLPRRSLMLLVLLLAYLPVQLILEPHWLGERARNAMAVIDGQVPAISVLRHLDIPLLALLAFWAVLGARSMAPIAQLIFHEILAVCAVWAASAACEIGFGLAFVTVPEN